MYFFNFLFSRSVYVHDSATVPVVGCRKMLFLRSFEKVFYDVMMSLFEYIIKIHLQ